MQLTRNPGTLALSIWLIATGLLTLLNLRFPASGTILSVLAIIAGGLLLFVSGRLHWKNLGLILLAIWLIATGLLALLSISFPASGLILPLLAVAAGALLLIGR